MKSIIAFIALIITMACKPQYAVTHSKIDVNTFHNQVVGKAVKLVDVRTASEYAKGYIDNAINIDILNTERFTKQVGNLNKSDPIYVYCFKGGRSNKARKVLQKLGFRKIYDFSGGWKAWTKFKTKKTEYVHY